MRNEQPGIIASAIGAAVVINALIFILAYWFAPTWLLLKLLAVQPALFVMIVAFPYSQHALFDIQRWAGHHQVERQKTANELEALKQEWKKLSGEGLPSTEPNGEQPIVEHSAEVERIGRWRAFWIAVMMYVIAHNSVVSWRDKDGNGLKSIIKKYPDWHGDFALPFIRKGWLTSVYGGVKTRLADGITAAHILNELSAGRLPPTPYGEPCKLETVSEFQRDETPSNVSQNAEAEFQNG